MRLRQEYRVHAHIDARLSAVAPDGQKLHDIAESLCVLNVLGRDLRDSLDGDILEADARIECDGREDCNLARCVETLDVSRRIRLGIALRLSLLEHAVVV